MMTREQLATIAQQWIVAGWQKGDTAAVYTMYAPDFVDVSNPHSTRGTREDNTNEIKKLYVAFPDFYATIDDLVLDTDAGKVAIRWSASGTHKGTFLGFPPTGQRILFHGIETLHIVNGLIIQRAGEWDEGNIMGQIAGTR